jgi:hypothetical protein
MSNFRKVWRFSFDSTDDRRSLWGWTETTVQETDKMEQTWNDTNFDRDAVS